MYICISNIDVVAIFAPFISENFDIVMNTAKIADQNYTNEKARLLN